MPSWWHVLLIMNSQLWHRGVAGGCNYAFKNTMDINSDFILRLSICEHQQPRALSPSSWNCVCVCARARGHTRHSQWGQIEVDVWVEGLISSVNHPRWVSRRGRDRMMVNLNKEIKSSKLEAKNKILQSPCLSFPVTMELTICLPRAAFIFFSF